MHRFTGKTVPVLLAAVVLVGGANLASYAADGHPLLLGHANDEAHTAAVTNHGHGPALRLATRRHAPPLAVTSRKKVARLNADKVDGINGGTVTTYTYRLRQVFSTSQFAQRFPGLATGRNYIVSYWLDANMTVNSDGLLCEIEANSLHGDPTTDEIAITESRHDFLVTNSASAFVTTRNRSLDLSCVTDSSNPTIDSIFGGSVTFVPVGDSHVRDAANARH
jgi:hypothetical protein